MDVDRDMRLGKYIGISRRLTVFILYILAIVLHGNGKVDILLEILLRVPERQTLLSHFLRPSSTVVAVMKQEI